MSGHHQCGEEAFVIHVSLLAGPASTFCCSSMHDEVPLLVCASHAPISKEKALLAVHFLNQSMCHGDLRWGFLNHGSLLLDICLLMLVDIIFRHLWKKHPFHSAHEG